MVRGEGICLLLGIVVIAGIVIQRSQRIMAALPQKQPKLFQPTVNPGYLPIPDDSGKKTDLFSGPNEHEFKEREKEVKERTALDLRPYSVSCSKVPRCLFGDDCSSNLMKSVEFTPVRDAVVRGRRTGLYEEFSSYVCGLSTVKKDSRISPFNDFNTVGKTFRGWVNLVLELAFFPDTRGSTSPKRYVLRQSDILRWKWHDDLDGSCKTRFNVDLCSQPSPKPEHVFNFRKDADGESLLFLWFMGARFVFERAMSGCFRHEVMQFASRTHVVSPSTAALQIDADAISVHIRRGDACERWSSTAQDIDLPRPCYTTDLYFARALRLRQLYGVNTIILGTDSEEVLHEMEVLCVAHNFTLHYLRFNRSLFNVKGLQAGPESFIENRDLTSKQRRLAVSSFFGELELLSRGTMMVGTSLSWVTRIVFMIIGGKLETIPPFMFVDSPYVNRERGAVIAWESTVEGVCFLCKCSSSQVH